MHGAAVAVFLYYFFGRVYFRLGVTIFDEENRKINVIGLNQGHNASSMRKLSMKNWGLQVSRLIDAMISL